MSKIAVAAAGVIYLGGVGPSQCLSEFSLFISVVLGGHACSGCVRQTQGELCIKGLIIWSVLAEVIRF